MTGISNLCAGLDDMQLNEVDIVELWRQVPPLLEACLLKDVFSLSGCFIGRSFDLAALRRLRQVNVQASEVVIKSLRTYTLTLEGPTTRSCGRRTAHDTNVLGASLLRHTALQKLDVDLLVSGQCWSHAFVKPGFQPDRCS